MEYVRYNTINITYRNKKVLKGKGISVTEILTAKRVSMLEKAKKLHGFVNEWSQDGKIMFFDTIINKVTSFIIEIFATNQLWEEKLLVL